MVLLKPIIELVLHAKLENWRYWKKKFNITDLSTSKELKRKENKKKQIGSLKIVSDLENKDINIIPYNEK